MEQCCPQVLSTDVPEFDSFRDGLYVTSGFLSLGALIIRIGFWAPYTSLIIRNSETAFCLLHRALLWMFHVFMLSICHTAASSKQRRRLPKMGGGPSSTRSRVKGATLIKAPKAQTWGIGARMIAGLGFRVCSRPTCIKNPTC